MRADGASAIVVARFYAELAAWLDGRRAARACATAASRDDDVAVVRVPGCFELAARGRRLIETRSLRRARCAGRRRPRRDAALRLRRRRVRARHHGRAAGDRGADRLRRAHDRHARAGGGARRPRRRRQGLCSGLAAATCCTSKLHADVAQDDGARRACFQQPSMAQRAFDDDRRLGRRRSTLPRSASASTRSRYERARTVDEIVDGDQKPRRARRAVQSASSAHTASRCCAARSPTTRRSRRGAARAQRASDGGQLAPGPSIAFSRRADRAGREARAIHDEQIAIDAAHRGTGSS